MKKRPTGFTLIELLVVVSIIALLIGILLPVLGKSRDAARQVKASSAVRQLLLGHMLYQGDHDGRVMFGYPPGYIEGRPLEVTLPSGHTLSAAAGPQESLPLQRYPIRMAPYQQDVWEILYDHTTPPERPRSGDTQSEVADKAYQLSHAPSFGINAVYVGGHFGKDGFDNSSGVFRPNAGGHVVFRDIEVHRASELIVFAESLLRGPGYDTGVNGHHVVTPPHANGEQWHVHNRDFHITNTSGFIGLPKGRYSDATVAGFFDGHAAALAPQELDDMRLWANWADGPDYDY